MRRAFLNFKRDEGVVLEVFREPDSGEMAPADFLDDNISTVDHLADMDWMVTADLIIFNPFIFAVVFFLDLLHYFSVGWSGRFIYHY